MSTVEVKTKTRRTPARNPEIVIAALDERLRVAVDADSPHATRIAELLDELKRGIRKGWSEDE